MSVATPPLYEGSRESNSILYISPSSVVNVVLNLFTRSLPLLSSTEISALASTATALFYSFVSILPITFHASLYSYAIRARIVLGQWPSFDNPDPKALGFTYHHEIIYYILSVTLISPAFYILFSILIKKYYKLWISTEFGKSLRRIYILFYVLIFIDFTGFFGWYLD